MTLGPQYHVSISAYNAVLQVQDNAYAHMIRPGETAAPTRIFITDAAKLQPRGDLIKALNNLEETTAKLQRALKKHNDLKKQKAIKKAHRA